MIDYNNKRSRMAAQSVSQLFEETVLSHAYKDDPYFQKFHMPSTFLPKPRNKQSDSAAGGKFYPQQIPSCSEHSYYSYQDFEGNEDSSKNNNTGHDHYWSQKWGWWNPPRDKWLIFKFFQQSSMHGLKFIAQPRRHLTERIFWAVAFMAATITSVILIASVWERYKETPVIVTFDSNELEINSIPFPAVTICNMNMISKDVLKNIFDRYMVNRTEDKRQEFLTNMQYLKSLCGNSGTFATRHHFAADRGHVSVEYNDSLFNDTHGEESGTGAAGSGILPFLYKEATSCEEMILKCTWAGVITDCGILFKPFLNEYGKCCTFNRLPTSLFYSDKIHKIDFGANSTSRWSREEVEGWKKWNYKEGFLLREETKYPERQMRAGSRFGLSILLDPNLDSYYCPVSDSQGFRIGLTNPLERADVKNIGLGVGLDQEIFMRIQPELTIADPDIRQFDFAKRQCLFEDEVQLDYFQPYAAQNCIIECTSKILEKNCSCVPYLLPRSPSMRICSPSRKDRKCFRMTRRKLNRDFSHFCGHCKSLCSKLVYRYKVSAAKLQHKNKLWFDVSDKIILPHWHEHKMSVVHIYFGKQEFVPLLRSELYGVRDLIANTGNILCLCLGFSVLSAVEILFFITCRPFWGSLRKNRHGSSGDTDTTVTGRTTDSHTNFHQTGKRRKFATIMHSRNHALDSSRNENEIIQVTSASLSVMNENSFVSRHQPKPTKHPFSYSDESSRKEK